MTAPTPRTGLSRLLPALRYSLQGLKAAFQNEAAFRQEILLAVILLPLACWLGSEATERILLIGSVLLILIVELLNSGIEAVVDLVSPEWHALAKRAKDMGSAAVLIALILCAITWLLIVWAKFF